LILAESTPLVVEEVNELASVINRIHSMMTTPYSFCFISSAI